MTTSIDRATLLVALLAHAHWALAGEPAAVLRLHADSGWFDEAFALDGAGGRLAVVRADAAGKLELEVHDLAQDGAVLWRLPLAGAPSAVRVLHAGVLVAWPSGDGERAALYDAGKVVGRFGPAAAIAAAEVEGREIIGVFARGPDAVEVGLHDASRPARPLVKRRFPIGAGGALEPPGLIPTGWRDAFTRVEGRRRGQFDPAADVVRPDRPATYDLLGGRFLSEPLQGEPPPPTVDESRYDPASLRVEPARDRAIFYSILTRTAAGPEEMHLWRQVPGGPPVRVLALPTGGRDLRWHAAGGRIAVLWRHRTFGRGGPDLVVMDFDVDH